MRILLVLAHPLEDSFAAAVAKVARETLAAGGHEVDLLDLIARVSIPVSRKPSGAAISTSLMMPQMSTISSRGCARRKA